MGRRSINAKNKVKYTEIVETAVEQTEDVDTNKQDELNDKITVEKSDKLDKEKTVEKEVPVIKTFDELLVYEITKNDIDTKHLINALEQFKHFIGTNDRNLIVNAKYTLYLALKRTFNEPDYNKFVKNINLLNKFVMMESKGILSPLFHASDDLLWKYGNENKIGNQLFIEVLNKLADPSTRSKESKKINIGVLFKYLNENGIRNLTRFYKM